MPSILTRQQVQTHHPDQDREYQPVPLKSVIGYGAGDAANNLAFTTVTMFLLVYYTDVAGISAAAAGTLMLVVRCFDAFTDLFAGQLVDRVHSRRFGKFRPFILFGSVPLLALTFLTFHVPAIGHTGMLIYAYLTYGALGLAYSLVNIPYGSLASAMSPRAADRSRLAGARTIGALVVSTILGTFISPLVSPQRNLQALFTSVTVIFMVIGTGLYLWTFFTTRETVIRTVPRVRLRQSIRTVRSNRPLLRLCLSSFTFMTCGLVVSSLQIYYFRDALNALPLTAALALGNCAITAVLAVLASRLVHTFGKRRLYCTAGCIIAIGGLGMTFAPPAAAWLGLAAALILQMGNSLGSMVTWALEADTIDWGEAQSGIRAEGLTYSAFTFIRKVGQAVGGGIAGFALSAGGYVAGAIVTQQVSWSIRVATGIIPALLGIASAAMMVKYPLTEGVHAQAVAQLAERRRQTLASAK